MNQVDTERHLDALQKRINWLDGKIVRYERTLRVYRDRKADLQETWTAMRANKREVAA